MAYMVSADRPLSTSDVAQALGLRPATVQMYARNGRIPFDQTPGGHRRFNLDEVREALGILDASMVAAPPTRSRGSTGWLVDATELDSWADRRTAQDELPVIVRVLVAGSVPDLEQLEFRGSEGVNLHGWDGLVRAPAGNPWVPGGQSAWEMGTAEDADRKANEDYAHRTANPGGLVPTATTFVFVTPRRWANRDSWATTKRAEGKWKDVRALDADSLEQWLDATPGAHARVTKMLGRDPEDATDINSAWGRWSGATSPVLPLKVVTSGRDQEMDRLWKWIHEKGPTPLAVVADSQEEAVAFVCSSLLQMPAADRAAIEGSTLIVRSSQAWDELLARTRTPLVLIATFPQPASSEASDAGHHVIVPLDRNGIPTGETIHVPRLRHEPATTAFEQAGLKEKKAGECASLARRSLIALRRRLAVDASVARPTWAQPDRATEIVPALLVGAWRDDRDADRGMLARLSGRSYEDFIETLTPWLTQPDPPVRRVGTLWYITSLEDAWILLRDFLTSAYIERFHECFAEVLGAVDPALDMEPSERWTAGIHGKVHPWSSNLRSGLADTLALVGSRETSSTLAGNLTRRDIADKAVMAVLNKANADLTAQRWSSLDDVLPLLAEAAPGVLLRLIDEGAESGALEAIFDPAAEAEPFGSPRHTGLLWALESLAWDPDYLSEAALCLARLAENDPGGRYANRPANSLREIFLPWHPHTRASIDDRLAVIDKLRLFTPVVAWVLMLVLLPAMHDSSTGTHQPRWREGESDPRGRLTFLDWQNHTHEIVHRLLQDVGTNGIRWSNLVSALQGLPPAQHDSVVVALEAVEVDTLTDADRDAIVSALRTFIHQHRRFPDAKWALPTDRIDRLQVQLDRFADAESPSGSAWLFSQSARIPQPVGTDYEGEECAIALAREEAGRRVLTNLGLEGIWALGSASEQPRYVGAALADVDQSWDETMIEQLDSPHDAHAQVARGYFLRRFENAGWDWAEPHLQQSDDWDEGRKLTFLQCVASDDRAFNWIERFGPELTKQYWRSLWPLRVEKDARPRAVLELALNGRGDAAMELLDFVVSDNDGTLPVGFTTDTVVDVLTKAASDFHGTDPTMFAFHVDKLLTFVEDAGDVDQSTLAKLEWLYLPLFEYHDRTPHVLHEELATNPEFFVNVIGFVYRSENDESTEVTEETRVRAELGYRLLRSWHTPPTNIREWVEQARILLTGRGLIKVGDINIGHVLRYVPLDSDGAWPTTSLRDLIEVVRSKDLEDGLITEVINSRGGGFRDLTAGGAEERTLAKQYSDYARTIGARWPRTRRVLEQIAEVWEQDARREDHRSEIREDFWGR